MPPNSHHGTCSGNAASGHGYLSRICRCANAEERVDGWCLVALRLLGIAWMLLRLPGVLNEAGPPVARRARAPRRTAGRGKPGISRLSRRFGFSRSVAAS